MAKLAARGSINQMINTIHTTTVMEPSKRAAGFYPRRCEYNRCLHPAWYIQHATRSDGAETMRVVCKGHSMTKRWTS